MTVKEGIVMWTIYDRPKDYPDKFVVRAWTVYDGNPVPVPGAKVYTADTLEEARKFVPAGLVRFAKHPTHDDPVIVETWL